MKYFDVKWEKFHLQRLLHRLWWRLQDNRGWFKPTPSYQIVTIVSIFSFRGPPPLSSFKWPDMSLNWIRMSFVLQRPSSTSIHQSIYHHSSYFASLIRIITPFLPWYSIYLWIPTNKSQYRNGIMQRDDNRCQKDLKINASSSNGTNRNKILLRF